MAVVGGGPKDFKPYLGDLINYVKGRVDLLVVTHEHNDHVNGFAKCPEYFERLDIHNAWMAWTENPNDPGGRAKELLEKRSKMKLALSNAIDDIEKKGKNIATAFAGDFNQGFIAEGHAAYLKGLNTIKGINLPASGGGKPLAGMIKIKEILKKKKIKIDYLEPGESKVLDNLPGIKFHVLGPPYERDSIFKEGKQGRDVYKKKLFLQDNSLSADAFINLGTGDYVENDLPFGEEYILDKNERSFLSSLTAGKELFQTEGGMITATYFNSQEAWRTIDMDWLSSAGSLALRLNSHINNTSLVLAVEMEDSPNKVLLLPGDAEYGSWESWHLIKKWNKKGKNGKHFVEDLLNRTVFYKVGHHLSYNGTALEKGINMMEHDNLIAMASLDRKRIADKWKSTMPNKYLVQDIIKRTKGKFFIMDETGVANAPSKTLDPSTLPKTQYECKCFSGTKKPIYIQCKVKL